MKTLVFCECSRPANKYYQKLLDGHFKRFFEHNVAPTIRRYRKDSPVSIIALDKESEWRLEHHSMAYETLPEVDQERVNHDLEKFCRSIAPSNRLLMGKLLFLSMSLWELDEAVIMEEYLRPVIGNIRLMSSIIERENPSRIVLFDAFSEKGKVIREIALKKGIQLDSHSTFLSESVHHVRRVMLPFANPKPNFLSAIRSQRNALQPFFNGSGKRVLFVVATEKWASVIQRIAKGMDYLIIGRDHGLRDAYSSLNFRPLHGYATADANKKIDFFRSYYPHYAELRDSEEFRSSFTFNGIRLWKVVAPMFRYLLTTAPEIVLAYYYVFQDVIRCEKPDVIVLFGDRTKFGKTIIEVANHYRIPTLVIQPSFATGRPIDGPTKASKVAVFGKHSADYLISKGGSKTGYEIAGNPKFDELIRQKNDPRLVRKKYEVPAGRKIVAIDPIGISREDADAIISPLRRSQDFFPIIANAETFSASYAAITKNSILDALVLGKIAIVPSESKVGVLENAGAVFLRPGLIARSLGRIKKSQTLKKREALKYLSYGNDGRSSQRIARLIGRMVDYEKDYSILY